MTLPSPQKSTPFCDENSAPIAPAFAAKSLDSRVRILSGQPASRVSGVIFPGGGESLTFPRVTLVDPSLWPVNFGISALAGQISGAGLWSPFSNFRLAVAETGSIADRDRFAGRTSGSGGRRHEARSLGRLFGRHATRFLSRKAVFLVGRLFQAIAPPRSSMPT